LTFPSNAEEPPAAGRRRPSAGRLITAGLLVVVVAIVVAWLLPPLGTGQSGAAAGPPGSEAGADPESGATQIRFVPAGEVRFGVEVRNTTFLPVTIDGLRGGRWVIEDVHLVLGTDPNLLSLADEHVRLFEPITLSPGATRLIGVVGRFPACPSARPNWATGTTATFTALRFDVRVAGLLPAEADVALLQPVELVGDADAACPR
jgi:hypothetical protein